MSPVSIRPSDMVEGGAPVDRNMLIRDPKFIIFQYTKKDGTPATKQDGTPATTIAAHMVLVEDDGTEHEQNYSVGDPNRYEIQDGGKSLGPDGVTISKSCNFSIFMNGTVNAGFPENRLGEDITVLDGLYAFWIGVPEPERSSLGRGGADQPKRQIPVPSQILKLPWEKAKPGQKVPAATGKAPAKKGAAPALSQEVIDSALEFIGSAVDESGTVTRQELAASVFTSLAKDPNRDAVAAAIFSPAMQAALLANGFTVDGEEISRA